MALGLGIGLGIPFGSSPLPPLEYDGYMVLMDDGTVGDFCLEGSTDNPYLLRHQS